MKFKAPMSDKMGQVDICIEGDKLLARSESDVYGMNLYTIDAALVAQAKGNVLAIGNMAQGTYIVRVVTANGYKNVKIYLNK